MRVVNKESEEKLADRGRSATPTMESPVTRPPEQEMEREGEAGR